MSTDPAAFAFPADWEWCDAKVTYQPKWKRLGSTPGPLKLAPRRAHRVTVRPETTPADLAALLRVAPDAHVRTVRVPHGGPIAAADLGGVLAKLKGVTTLALDWPFRATGWTVTLGLAGGGKVQLDLDGWPVAEVVAAVGRIPRADELAVRMEEHPAGFALGPLFAVRGLKRLRVEHRHHSKQELDWTGLAAQTGLQRVEVRYGVLPGGFWAELGRLPRLRELGLWWPEAAKPAPPRCLAGLRSLKRLTGTCLFDAAPDAFRALAGAPAVADVKIDQCRLDDATAAALGAMPAVTDGHVWNAKLTDAGMKALCRWPKVKKLALAEDSGNPTPVTAAGFKALGTLTTLEDLHLQGFDRVDRAGWAALAGLPRLRRLRLFAQTPFDPLEAVGPVRTLEHLTLLNCTGLGPAGYGLLRDLTRLRSLAVYVFPYRPYHVPLAEVGELRRLTTLALGSLTRMTDDQFARVGGLGELERLYVSDAARLTDRGIEAIGGLRRLRLLALRGNPKLTDRALAAVAALPRLDTLLVRCSTKMTDAGLAALAAARRLRVLHIDHARALTGKALLRLVKPLRLEELAVSSSPHLTDADLLALTRHPTLKRVAVRECKRVTGDGMVAVAAARPDWGTPDYHLGMAP